MYLLTAFAISALTLLVVLLLPDLYGSLSHLTQDLVNMVQEEDVKVGSINITLMEIFRFTPLCFLLYIVDLCSITRAVQ